jgi:hypothetical protein
MREIRLAARAMGEFDPRIGSEGQPTLSPRLFQAA